MDARGLFAPAPVQVSQTRTQGGKIDERSPVQSKRIELYVQTTHVTLFEEDSVLFLKGLLQFVYTEYVILCE